jgi:acyl-CoA reductase-like NAD-dependent aldehyde dehydrogenase
MEPTVVKESANLAGNYVGGKWQRSQSSSALDVINPATSESLARIALAQAYARLADLHLQLGEKII